MIVTLTSNSRVQDVRQSNDGLWRAKRILPIHSLTKPSAKKRKLLELFIQIQTREQRALMRRVYAAIQVQRQKGSDFGLLRILPKTVYRSFNL